MDHKNLKRYALAAAIAGMFGSSLVACGGSDGANGNSSAADAAATAAAAAAVASSNAAAASSNSANAAAAAAAASASSAAAATAAGAAAPTGGAALLLLSSKADYVSSGTTLVDVTLPAAPAGSNSTPAVTVSVNGSDVTSAFSPNPANPGHLLGLAPGLNVGPNTLQSNYNGVTSTVALSNYPVTGPMLAGPQTPFFTCETGQFMLPNNTPLTLPNAPADINCSAPTVVQYMYRSTSGGALKSMSSSTTLPSDVGMTTTTDGKKVPFVVRIETGTMNRGIYQNAILFDPTTETVGPLTPPKGWNKRLIAVHGTGCANGWYIQGASMGVSPYTDINLTRLGEGYAVFTNTLNHPTNSCNAILAGETTLMGKEHFIKTFGVPNLTVSVGTSGGSYTSLQVADAFPGIFDGVFIDATFPDALVISITAMDDKLLNHYYTGHTSLSMTEALMVSVSGHKVARAWYDSALQSGRTDPVSGRVETIPVGSVAAAYQSGSFDKAVPVSQRWNATTNKTGARATVFDAAHNVYGVDADGYALRPFDNIGVQYGLVQVNTGVITVDQFLDMNAAMGGYDRDGNYTTTRTLGDPGAIKRAYQAGLFMSASGGLATIPIFDRSYIYDDDTLYHYQWFHFAMRERLLQANGDTLNHVMWRGGLNSTEIVAFAASGGSLPSPAPGTGERMAVHIKSLADGWPLFIKWVATYKADTSAGNQRSKMLAAKPAAAVDGCFTLSTSPQFIAEKQVPGTDGATGTCNAIWPSWSYPRAQAGASIAADKLKCDVKVVAASDYSVPFTAAQMTRLAGIFPNGVCDWTKPGVNQTTVVPYPSVGPSPKNLVFDINHP